MKACPSLTAKAEINLKSLLGRPAAERLPRIHMIADLSSYSYGIYS